MNPRNDVPYTRLHQNELSISVEDLTGSSIHPLSESANRAAGSCGLHWCGSRPGESTREGCLAITAEFDYRANVLAAHQARIASDFAFFTGTQLFLLPGGHRSRPSVVRFDVVDRRCPETYRLKKPSYEFLVIR